MKSINLEKLPKRGKLIDWKNSIGQEIDFIYNDIKGILKINSYIYKQEKRRGYIIIEYNKKEFECETGTIKNCHLEKILGINREGADFIFNIGDRIVDEKRDLTIIDRYCDDNNCNRKYKLKCNICNYDNIIYDSYMVENKVGEGSVGSCPCCNSRIVVKGINDIATTDTWMIPYLKNKEDAYKYTSQSNKKIPFICPFCLEEREERINNVYKKHKLCLKCENTNYFTETFVFNVLNQLYPKINIINQFSSKHSKWCNNKRYDFYFKLNNEEYIIEVHGIQHYEKSFKNLGTKTLEEEQANDKYKYELAISNGIKPENYIVVDFRYSTLQWGKEHILNSRLSEIFDLSNINWEKCLEKSMRDNNKIYSDLWNEGYGTKEICYITKKSSGTVVKWLKQGKMLKWNNYSLEESNKRRNLYNSKHSTSKRKIKCEELNMIFDSVKECMQYLTELTNENYTHTNMYKHLNKENNKYYYKNYTFYFI